MRVGVVVGRFQVPDLHEGHKRLIQFVGTQCDQLVILVGTSPAVPTRRNPLDFPTRYQMLRTAFPGALVWPIEDENSDERWSQKLDRLLKPLGGQVTLYGSRDSFLPHYEGRYPKFEVTDAHIEPVEISATGLREQIQYSVDSTDFRKGVIYAQNNARARVCPVVDIIVYRDGKILAGRRANETEWRFPGGWVEPTDESLEAAARRELAEETGLSAPRRTLEYVCSERMGTWCYLEENRVFTTVFAWNMEQCKEVAIAGDDLAEVDWFTPYGTDLWDKLIIPHRYLLSTYNQKFSRGRRIHNVNYNPPGLQTQIF